MPKRKNYIDGLPNWLVSAVVFVITIIAAGWLIRTVGGWLTGLTCMTLAYFGDRYMEGLPLIPRLGPKRKSGTVKKNLNVDDNIHTDTIGYGSNPAVHQRNQGD